MACCSLMEFGHTVQFQKDTASHVHKGCLAKQNVIRRQPRYQKQCSFSIYRYGLKRRNLADRYVAILGWQKTIKYIFFRVCLLLDDVIRRKVRREKRKSVDSAARAYSSFIRIVRAFSRLLIPRGNDIFFLQADTAESLSFWQ